jgi:hypothetical protein
MTILNITEAAEACGVNRKTLQRYIRSGRLSAITGPTGERGIDVAELIRVFGPLSRLSHPETATESRAIRPPVAPILPVVAPHDALVELLQEQLREAKEREHQARLEKDRLLTLLETAQQALQAEQQARHDLETKLLPAPRPTRTGNRRPWWLAAVLVAVLAFAGWHFRAVIVSALAS